MISYDTESPRGQTISLFVCSSLRRELPWVVNIQSVPCKCLPPLSAVPNNNWARIAFPPPSSSVLWLSQYLLVKKAFFFYDFVCACSSRYGIDKFSSLSIIVLSSQLISQGEFELLLSFYLRALVVFAIFFSFIKGRLSLLSVYHCWLSLTMESMRMPTFKLTSFKGRGRAEVIQYKISS